MNKNFKSYYWDNGRPRGFNVVDDSEPVTYKVIVDPYYKRYTLEKYKEGKFADIIYDSALYDFRWLKPQEQAAWQKQTIEESASEQTCLIRNQDDRVISTEKYTFEKGLCTTCEIYYPHGPLIATQRITYTKLGAEENVVTLLDRLKNPVVIKKYESNEETGEFTTMISELWNTQNINEIADSNIT
ncbi:MAG: hypothetical protein AAGG81_04950 [Chlamydiota bacterium]